MYTFLYYLHPRHLFFYSLTLSFTKFLSDVLHFLTRNSSRRQRRRDRLLRRLRSNDSDVVRTIQNPNPSLGHTNISLVPVFPLFSLSTPVSPGSSGLVYPGNQVSFLIENGTLPHFSLHVLSVVHYNYESILEIKREL